MRDDPREIAGQDFREQLAPLIALADSHPDASEVFVNGDAMWLADGATKRRLSFHDFERLTPRTIQGAAATAAVHAGAELGPMPPALPLLSVKLPPDLRVTFAAPPAADRWYMAMRFLRSRKLTLDSYVQQKIMTGQQVAAVRGMLSGTAAMVRDTTSPTEAGSIRDLLSSRQNIVVSGGTASGKTTLLRAMLSELDPEERVIVIEDTPEISLPHPAAVHLNTTLNVDLAMLLRHTLRLTPDRIVLGEVRGPEALELITANNTGHEGTLCTLHSNGAKQALSRLHTQCRKVQPHFPFEEVAMAFDAVVQIQGKGNARRVTDIWRVPR